MHIKIMLCCMAFKACCCCTCSHTSHSYVHGYSYGITLCYTVKIETIVFSGGVGGVSTKPDAHLWNGTQQRTKHSLSVKNCVLNTYPRTSYICTANIHTSHCIYTTVAYGHIYICLQSRIPFAHAVYE